MQEYKSVLNLYKADQNGEGLKEIYTFEINENQGIYDIMVNSSQEILLAVSTFDNKTGSSNFTILKIDVMIFFFFFILTLLLLIFPTRSDR